MSSHHSDQMSQTSQVSRVTLLLCFQKVSQSVSQWLSDKVTYWAGGWTAKNISIHTIPWIKHSHITHKVYCVHCPNVVDNKNSSFKSLLPISHSLIPSMLGCSNRILLFLVRFLILDQWLFWCWCLNLTCWTQKALLWQVRCFTGCSPFGISYVSTLNNQTESMIMTTRGHNSKLKLRVNLKVWVTYWLSHSE